MESAKTEEKNDEARVTQVLKSSHQNGLETLIYRLKQKDWREIGFEVAIVFLLISFALFIRLVLSYETRANYYHISGPDVWDLNLPFNIGNADLRGFADFGFYYNQWITAWYENNWYLYEWVEPINVYDYYSYPPVFMYFLILIWRPGMSNLWMAFPMIFADAACGGVVYLILREVNKTKTSRIIAIIGGILMAIAPINVIYDGIYWLNPGPVTLLTIIAFYFAVKKKWWQAFFWLAIATMTKQNALFFTYPLFMVMVGQKIREKKIVEAILESIMNAALFVGVCLLLSVPYIFISPVEYGRHMLFPGRRIQIDITIPIWAANNDCVSFDRSILKIIFGIDSQFSGFEHLVEDLTGFPRFIISAITFGTYSMLWMISSASIIAIGMFWRSYTNRLDNCEFFEWIAVYTIFTHIFMPRGVYKFYTAYFVPILLVAFMGSITHFFSNKKTVTLSTILAGGIFLGFNIWLLYMDRFALPFYLFLVALFIGLLGFLRADGRYIKYKRLWQKKIDVLVFNGKMTI